MKRRARFALLVFIVTGLGAITVSAHFTARPLATQKFDGARAYQHVVRQVALGPRTPGSSAHAAAVSLIREELNQAGWQTEVQETTKMGHPIQNIIAKRNDALPVVILGAHYDSRIKADKDPDVSKQSDAVPGGNDGASGVAVLLELARVLPMDSIPVWLVFFDAEDNGDIAGWDWILGSRAFAETLTFTPQAVVVVDMIGDKDLQIYQEASSNQALNEAIWAQAQALGHTAFVPKGHYDILDDHVPFLEKGIPAVDIIDINYDYWHTTQDTADKVSAESLDAVGETLLAWLVTLTR